jgi:hypothetical protein
MELIFENNLNHMRELQIIKDKDELNNSVRVELR